MSAPAYAYDLFRADRVRLTATTSTVTARERRGTDGRVERSVSRPDERANSCV